MCGVSVGGDRHVVCQQFTVEHPLMRRSRGRPIHSRIRKGLNPVEKRFSQRIIVALLTAADPNATLMLFAIMPCCWLAHAHTRQPLEWVVVESSS